MSEQNSQLEETFQCEVTQSGFVAGSFHPAGTVLTLTDRQKDCGLRRGRIRVLEGDEVYNPEVDEAEIEKVCPPSALLTINQIKTELDSRGIDYSDCVKKADFVSLLSQAIDNDSQDPLG